MSMKKYLIAVMLTLVCIPAISRNKVSITHGPYLQNLAADEVTIVWVADKTSVGWVEILPDDGSNFYKCARPQFYDSKNGIKTESTIHKVRITGLKPGTSYRYRIYSTEILEHKGNYVSYGNVAATIVYGKEPLKFTTLDPGKDRVSFAMVNDMHGDPAKMEGLLKLCDMDSTDMILFVGDMVSIFNSEEQVFGGFMDKAVEMFAAEKPMFYTRGNHETRGELAYHFQDYFSPSQEHIYYMLRQGPVCFIALDSGEDKPDNDIEYYGINEYEKYRTEQARWLKEVIKSEEFQSAPFKIVTCHIPPLGGWFGEEEVENKFIPILNEAGVDLMLCGHTHKHHHLSPGEKADFPIIINSNVDILQCTVSGSDLELKILDKDGVEKDTLTLKK